MKGKKGTLRALLMSLLSLMLCVSMLIGTTFAWFTDSVTSANNIIQSGTLDIVLEYWNGDSWEDAEGQVIPFVAKDGRAQNQILWEPGCTYAMAPIRVRNEGNLNAKILILINGIIGDEKLMEAIELKTGINNIPQSLLNGSAGNIFQRFEGAQVDIMYGMPEGNVVFDHSLAGKGTVTPGTGHTDTSPEFTISGHMKEEAGNEYQGLSIEGISITVLATQQTYESDSFGNQYDKDATYPVVVRNFEGLKEGKGSSGDYVLGDNMSADTHIYFGDNTDNSIDLNGKTVSSSGANLFVSQGAGCTVTINGTGTVDAGSTQVVYASSSGTFNVNGGTYQLGDTDKAAHLYSQNSGTIVINDGTFISTDANTPIVYCINGFIEINGGFFQNTANPAQALLSMGNNFNYANNQKITLRGGTFVNWNPMSSAFARPWTNPDVPALIVLADGYTVVSETQANGDIWYTVVKA